MGIRLAAFAAAFALTVAVPAAAAARPRVSVSPIPGAVSASPSTQLSFRGIARGRIGAVRVTGSRSGRHAGVLRAHSDGRGASWVPKRRFRGGETVTVRTHLRLHGAARHGDFSFRVARIPPRVTLPKGILEDVAAGRTHHFHSRPDLIPPIVTVDPGALPTAPGYVFLSAKTKRDTKQSGPLIVDSRGEPVWFNPLPGIQAATDFRVQEFKGTPVLTYWEGTSRQGIGVGDLVVMDQSYRPIRRIRVADGYRPDLHEFLLTPRGTAILVTYPVVRADLRRVGGSRHGLVVDSVVQEVDLDTGLVRFEWHSLGKIALRETYSRPSKSPRIPFDYAHVNAVALDHDGDLLISARNTWAVYKVDRATGAVHWRLGGRRSDFKLGPGARFAWQHDVRRRSDGLLTLFDNSAFPPVRKHSRAIALQLDERRHTATLARALTHPLGLLAATQGNQQELPNGDTFVGWGSQRYFTEYGPNGAVLWDAHVSTGYESYRAYRMPWVGRPRTRPDVAAVPSGAGMDVYASWNGATQVASWQVLAGPSPKSLQPVAAAARSGFETRIAVPARASYVAARALDASGRVLATSASARPRAPAASGSS